MKKGLVLFLICMMVISLLFDCSAEEKAPESFISGDWEYILLEDDTVEITRYSGSAAKLMVPDHLDGKTVTSIGKNAFSQNFSLKSIVIPDSVTCIEDFAFMLCGSLSAVKLSKGLMHIGERAFGYCASLISITIPDSVTSIGVNPFVGCELLSKIKVSADHPILAVTDGVLFSKPDKRLVSYPVAFTADSYEIPQGIQVLGD